AVIAAAVAIIAHGQLRELKREPLMITVALPPLADETTTRATTGRRDPLAEVVEWLQAQPGVLFVEPLPEAELGKLVEPWLADGNSGETLPMPRLVDVGLNAWERPDVGAMATRLQEILPGTTIGETGIVQDTRERTLVFTRGFGLAVAGGALLAAALAFMIVTGVHLRFERDAIDLLRLMGANDGYLARQFELHALFQAFRGVLWGFGCAAVVLLLAIYSNRFIHYELPFSFRLDSLDWFLLTVPPALLAILVAVAARLSAQFGLARES
ncbi:MAG: FtsX-like permease family protein, partial [Geminicoccaceae bacterium]